jgi:hypothetical protein
VYLRTTGVVWEEIKVCRRYMVDRCSPAALEGLNVDAYYVVIQGRKPGVYTSRYFSAVRTFIFLLTYECSSAGLAATGSNVRGLCCMVATRELANAMFVENAMMGDVENIL